MHGGKILPQQLAVPPLAGRLFLAPGERVVVELRAHVNRRLVGKGIARTQRRPRGLVFQKPFKETPKPAKALRIVERRKPHLPVEARLMRDVPRRGAGGIARSVDAFDYRAFASALL